MKITALVLMAFVGGLHSAHRAPADIDPIVTGVKITAKHREDWLHARKRYLECGFCFAAQPFPAN